MEKLHVKYNQYDSRLTLFMVAESKAQYDCKKTVTLVVPCGAIVRYAVFGKDKVVFYRVAFKDFELQFPPEDFRKDEMELITPPEME